MNSARYSSARVLGRLGLLTFGLLMSCVGSGAVANRGRVGNGDVLSSNTYLRLMSPGWNLGNTLEALPNETAWGNPLTTPALLKGVKASGFKSIRIPVAWTQYADSENNISPTWMAHVTQIVNDARKAGLYVILNIHWDGGWMQPTYAQQATVNAKLRKFWTQIATSFKDYDDHLLFAGTNEVGVKDVYGPPTAENSVVQNSFNQTFVTAVRATGGKNASRYLVIQGYNTNIDDAVTSNAKLPTDTAANKLMMEVHYYSPYNFTLNEKSKIWQWGTIAKDASATETWANEAYADAEFQKMKAAFVDKGMPVILGEYSAGLKPNYPGMNVYRKYWDQYITRSAYRHGMVPLYWDAGTDGGLFKRATGAQQDSEVISTIVKAAR